MADMIKFYKGEVNNLPTIGINGALYVTTDEGAIYFGTGTGMKRLGDFVQVDNVAALPEKAHESCLYYCVAENILAKWNGTEWKQINKQPTAEELKTLLGLGSLAYKSEVVEADFDVNLTAKVSKWDAAEQNAKDHADAELAKKVDKVEGYSLVADTEIARLANVDNYNDAEVRGLIGDNADAIAEITSDYVKAADIANFETKENVKKVADDLAAYVESNDAAVALKADKSVVDTMYTNAKIDELVQSVKDYADANDADTKYGIVYDSETKKIKLVEGGTEVEIDATDFIKDGMIETVALSEDGLNLVITWNTDAGKSETSIPLTGLVDIYTGVSGDRITVTVSSDDKISADLVAGSITKNYLDSDVQASLAKADSALQEHQDISHLATTEALTAAIEAVRTEATNQDAVVLAESQKYTNNAKAEAIADAEGKVNALAGNVYTKEEVYTKAEVEALLTWGSF